MKITRYMGMAFAIATLASCSNDEDLTSAWQNDPAAMKVHATVGSGIFSRSNPLGADEATQKKFNGGDKISIAAGTQGAVTYTLNNGTWTPETGKYLKWETDEMKITAYYPVTEGASTQAFTLPADQSDNDKIALADYMTYSDQSAPDNSVELSIEMARKMARVIVTIAGFKNQYGNADVPTVSDVRIKSAAAGYSADAASGSAMAVTPYIQNLNGESVQVGTTYTVLVVPTDAKPTESFITMSVNGTALIVNGIPKMEVGRSYTYNLTIGKDALIVGNVSVKNWATGEIVGGEATVIKKNFKEAYTEADYYLWDAADPVKGTNPNFSEVSSAQTDLFKSCPTASQMVAYLKAGVYWDDNTTVTDGRQTYSAPYGNERKTDLHTGLWVKKSAKIPTFNTETDMTYTTTSETFKKLSSLTNPEVETIRTGGDYFFLPAAGYYFGGFLGAGSYGFYWSGTPFGDDLAYHLYFLDGHADVYGAVRVNGFLPLVAE